MKETKENISEAQKKMLSSIGVSFPALEKAMAEKEQILKERHTIEEDRTAKEYEIIEKERNKAK